MQVVLPMTNAEKKEKVENRQCTICWILPGVNRGPRKGRGRRIHVESPQDARAGTPLGQTMCRPHRRTHWRSRKRGSERILRVANRASDCRVLAKFASYGGAERDAASWSGRRKIYPHARARARTTPPPLRYAAPRRRISGAALATPPLGAASLKQLRGGVRRRGKTEKSSLGFARRSDVSRRSGRWLPVGEKRWKSDGYYDGLVGRPNVFGGVRPRRQLLCV